MKLLRFALVFAGLLLTGLLAQQTPSPVPLHHTTQEALERLATVIAEKRQQLATLLPGDPAAKALTDEVQQLRQQFAGLASRLDIQEFETPQHRQLDLQHEIEQLVRPLLQFLNEATAEPRKEADLKGRIALLEQRLGTANAASAAVGTGTARALATHDARHARRTAGAAGQPGAADGRLRLAAVEHHRPGAEVRAQQRPQPAAGGADLLRGVLHAALLRQCAAAVPPRTHLLAAADRVPAARRPRTGRGRRSDGGAMGTRGRSASCSCSVLAGSSCARCRSSSSRSGCC